MASTVKTYNPKEVTVTIGSHIVTGYAEDSFVTIEPNGDGITKVVGCDGEIARAISPDNTYNVKFSLLQNSDSNAYLSNMCDVDRDTGDGMQPLLVKDLKGGDIFQTDAAWVVRKPTLTRGKGVNNREWEIATGDATLTC